MVLPFSKKEVYKATADPNSKDNNKNGTMIIKFGLIFILAYTGGFIHGSGGGGVSKDINNKNDENHRGTNNNNKNQRGTCECASSSSTMQLLRSTNQKMTPQNNNGMIKPFERTIPPMEFLPGHETDTYTFFHDYVRTFGKETFEPITDFSNFPLLHIWPNYFEAYHNHWQRYRGKKNVVFMEIGVQSGGKIGMLREYFGSGLTYVGIDINPSCKMFESADWVHIEIGDSSNRQFLESIKQKYPHVDIFLDDGGHSMEQQRLAMEIMFPHVASDGVYACEDLNTSWNSLQRYGGKKSVDIRDDYFREHTMMGLIHRSIDWLHYGWVNGRTGKMDEPEAIDNDFWPETWWKEFATTVKHIHMYNQIVVYEKGSVEIFQTKTIGYQLPIRESGTHEKVNWNQISNHISKHTGSGYHW